MELTNKINKLDVKDRNKQMSKPHFCFTNITSHHITSYRSILDDFFFLRRCGGAVYLPLVYVSDIDDGNHSVAKMQPWNKRMNLGPKKQQLSIYSCK